jgi:peptidyl-prolyl cis-trans isomerase B (cyclophilin B)
VISKQEQERRARDYRARRTVHERRQRRQRRDSLLGTALALVVLLGGAGAIWAQQEANAVRVPDASLAEGRTWTGTMTINGVELGVELDGAAAPQAVSAMVYDTRRDYYDGRTCHRLTTSDSFKVLQCGSVDGAGSGDPEFRYGPIENAPEDDLYVEGTIAMARQGGDGESMGHQFFIVHGDTTIPSDEAGGYTVVGSVTSGLDQLREQVIAAGTAPDAQNPADAAPAITVEIDDFELQ